MTRMEKPTRNLRCTTSPFARTRHRLWNCSNRAKIPGKHPALQGTAAQVRTMSFDGAKDVGAKRAGLKKVVKAWCDWRARG